MIGLAGTGSSQAAVNYLVFQYSAGSAWVTPPAGLSLTVTARVQLTCPAGANKTAFGTNFALTAGLQSGLNDAGNISTSGAVCVLGVPNTVKLTATDWVVGDVILNLADTTPTSLQANYTTGTNGSAPSYLLSVRSVTVVLPDGKIVGFSSYIHANSGSPAFYYGVSIVARSPPGALDLASGPYNLISGALTSTAQPSLNIGCGGCANAIPIGYLMGY